MPEMLLFGYHEDINKIKWTRALVLCLAKVVSYMKRIKYKWRIKIINLNYLKRKYRIKKRF